MRKENANAEIERIYILMRGIDCLKETVDLKSQRFWVSTITTPLCFSSADYAYERRVVKMKLRQKEIMIWLFEAFRICLEFASSNAEQRRANHPSSTVPSPFHPHLSSFLQIYTKHLNWIIIIETIIASWLNICIHFFILHLLILLLWFPYQFKYVHLRVFSPHSPSWIANKTIKWCPNAAANAKYPESRTERHV